MEQIKNSFDPITLKKIAKGAAYSFLAAGAVSALNYAAGQDFGNAIVNSLVAALIPTLIHSIEQYSKGV